MPEQTRKWPDDLGRAIGLAALKAPNVKAATKALHEGRLGDFGAVPMPYSTVTYYAKRERARLEQEAQEEEERLRPKPLDSRIDAGARKLLGMLEREIERQDKATKHDPRRIGEIAASLKKVRELAKPDEPSKQPSKDAKPVDALTAALTSPSPSHSQREKNTEAVAPNTTTKDNSEATIIVAEQKNTNNETDTTSGVRAGFAGPWSASAA